MRGKKFLLLGLTVCLVSIFSFNVFAQPSPSQTVGGVTRQEKDLEKAKSIDKKLETERPKVQEESTAELIPAGSGPTTKVNKIVVEGVTLITSDVINGITAKFEGQDLSIQAIQKVADLITDEYRKKGFVTSRAYVPPQSIKDGNLLIKIVEGRLGNLEIKNNKYFKTGLLEKKIGMTEQGYFDYSALQKSLVYINEHPDRKAKATLVPGKTAGTTDVIIDVKDRFPVHVGFEYDNFGSRYIEKNRYSTVVEHNNLLGFDDKLYYKFQMAESDSMYLQQMRYVIPINSGWEMGAYIAHSRLTLGKEYKVLDARGKADIMGIFTTKALIVTDKMDLRYNAGFDYKRIRNYQLSERSSQDRLRVLKNGLDLDFNDVLGRNILLTEFDFGLPHFLGGMDGKDANASRAGAGNQFNKLLINYYRLQPLAWDAALLWKNNAQVSNYNLTASEQFQIGGPSSVRGYPVAEYSGDKGFYTSLELSLPFYGLSKDWSCPLTGVRFYDALRFVTFYDIASANTNHPAAGDKKHQILRGYGFGFRMNLKDNVSLRVELGYPAGKTPSDGDHVHPWIELITKF